MSGLVNFESTCSRHKTGKMKYNCLLKISFNITIQNIILEWPKPSNMIDLEKEIMNSNDPF
jgi:hypothetical protein